MKEPPFQTENWSILLARWNDATAALTYLLEQVGPGGPINFYNPQSYDHGLDGIDNRGFDFSFSGFPIILLGHLKKDSFLIFSNT